MTDTAAAPVSAVRREIALLLATVQYFTRIPAPAWVGYSQQRLNDSARYLPLVGALVGAALYGDRKSVV